MVIIVTAGSDRIIRLKLGQNYYKLNTFEDFSTGLVYVLH